MKEKEVQLTLEEIDYLLKGSIHWNDIESRVDAPPRKPIETKNLKSPLGKSELEKPPLFTEPKRVEPLEPRPFLEGKSVYWVLSGIGMITLGTWAYFVFAG